MGASCTRAERVGHRSRNRIIGRLSDAQYVRLVERGELVRVPHKTVLLHRDAQSPHVFFPDTAVVSLVTAFEDGRSVQAALVGNEGVVGIHTVLDSPVALHDALVLVDGEVCRISADLFREEIERSDELRRLITLYLQALMVQFAQTAACNRAHALRQRACRWLLDLHDRTHADRFALTQDVMAATLGVRRAGVTDVIRQLSQAGAIDHRPGVVTIRDRHGLEAEACECYLIARRRFDEVFG